MVKSVCSHNAVIESEVKQVVHIFLGLALEGVQVVNNEIVVFEAELEAGRRRVPLSKMCRVQQVEYPLVVDLQERAIDSVFSASLFRLGGNPGEEVADGPRDHAPVVAFLYDGLWRRFVPSERV